MSVPLQKKVLPKALQSFTVSHIPLIFARSGILGPVHSSPGIQFPSLRLPSPLRMLPLSFLLHVADTGTRLTQLSGGV